METSGIDTWGTWKKERISCPAPEKAGAWVEEESSFGDEKEEEEEGGGGERTRVLSAPIRRAL